MALSIAGPLILIGGERYPETGWRGGPLLLLCCAGVGFAVQALLARERATAARRARLLGVMGDGVVVTNAHGRVLEVNDALCRITGYAADELLGRTAPLPSWPEEDHAALLEAHSSRDSRRRRRDRGAAGAQGRHRAVRRYQRAVDGQAGRR